MRISSQTPGVEATPDIQSGVIRSYAAVLSSSSRRSQLINGFQLAKLRLTTQPKRVSPRAFAQVDEPVVVEVVKGVARNIEIMVRHEPKRTDGGQCTAVFAVKLVDSIAINDQFPPVTARQVATERFDQNCQPSFLNMYPVLYFDLMWLERFRDLATSHRWKKDLTRIVVVR